ncbi:MAG: hypothetical protein IJ131_11110 [Eggerthellaceae bacterium]|nr:hypothetical protein [Eggerthellaceae bacterium]
MAPSKALVVKKMTVCADRIVVEVVCSPEHLFTTPSMAQRACELRPNLSRHSCVNGKGPTFGTVMDRTPLPHLFEHLVVDHIVERSGAPDDIFVGTSEWVDRDRGEARVEVSFADDLEALGAIKDAAELINVIACG